MKKVLILLSISLSILACKQNNPKRDNPKEVAVNKAFDSLLKQYYEDNLKLHPLDATFSGDHRYNHLLPNPLSEEFQTKELAFYEDYLKKAQSFKDEELTKDQQLSKDILVWECTTNIEKRAYNEDLMPINQFWSLQLTIGQLASGASAQPFNTPKDYKDWYMRLESYVDWLASAEAKMKEGIEKGFVLPKSLIKKVLPQLKALTTTNLDEHLFFQPIKNLPEDFSDVDKNSLTKGYENLLLTKIIPAYTQLYHFMSTDYLNAGRESCGIYDIPGGKAYYQFLIKEYTTTSMSAEEIHKLGLEEVERITKAMEKIKENVGFKGDLKAFFNYVRTNKDLMPFDDPKQVIDNFNNIKEKMQPQLNKLFNVKPKTPFEVRRTEAFREASASAEYNPGSIDGTRPGIFYVPIPDVTQYNTFSDESLFLHEAIPGHHYQISLQQENENIPDFRKTLFYSAFGEGWALYCESLGKELGLYTDPYQYFGMLSAEMHRAIRLVVDTGIHAKGWTREEAIQYSLAHEAESEASITAEIERYMAIPGQALSYKIGQLKILELKDKAQKELGNNFDIAEFHSQILESGNMPLALLETKINDWIASKK